MFGPDDHREAVTEVPDIRLRRHDANAAYLAAGLAEGGYSVHYPGLPAHPQHELLSRMVNPGSATGAS